MKSNFDGCASHNFISTRLATELIAGGAPYSRCELPIMQGTIRAGVSRISLLADITVVHQGSLKRLRTEKCWVWDMGCDITLCHSTLEDECLYPPQAGPTDDIQLLQYVTVSGPFRAGEGEALLLSHLRDRSSRISATSLAQVAQVRKQPDPVAPKKLSQQEEDTAAEEVFRNFAQSGRDNPELSSDASTTCARFDGMKFEEVLELRRSLLKQLRTPVEDIRKRLEEIKALYPEAFGEDISTPCSLRKFEIRLKDGFRYICFLPRRVSEPVLADMKTQITELLRMGIIEESRDSPFSFPIVMAKKPGTTKLRLCVDFSAQNEQTIPLPFTVPDAREQLDRLAGNNFFCSLDCSSFFHQFEIREEDRDYTAFVVPWGMKYRWKRAPFGLRNCPAHCQREFQHLLASNGLADIVPYFDDVCFGAKTADELCEKFEKLLRVAVSAGLKFKESKCVLGMTAISHLGFVCDKDGIYLHPDRVVKLLKLPAAKDVDHLRTILGAFTYVRGWIKNAATISAPLTDLLKKEAGWEWGPDQENALRALKEACFLAPCLQGNIDITKEIFMATDACLLGVAACLFQYFDSGQLDSEGKPVLIPRPIMYQSRRFSPTESRWTMNSKEAYSIKFAFEKFGNLLLGHKVTVLTDHRNSLWMHNSGEPKVQRWRLYLSRWDYKIGFIDGVQNSVSDALSRLHSKNLFESAPSDAEAREMRGDTYGADEEGMEVTDADVSSALFNTIIEHSIHDMGLSPECLAWERERLECLLAGIESTVESATANSATANPVSGNANQPEVPAAVESPAAVEIEEISDQQAPFRLLSKLKQVHNGTCGHFGTFVTYRRLLTLIDDNFDMTPGEIRDEVTRFINACPECQKCASAPSPWQSYRFIRKRPFKEISIDVLVMPTSDISGARKVLAVICGFSRAIELFPLEFADGPRVAECLYWIRNRYGPFDDVRCDGAKAFVSSVVPLYLKLCGTALHPVTAYAHWQNGMVEVAHRSVLRHLRHLISEDAAGPNSHLSWATLLSAARRIMMNTTNASTGETPNAFVYGGFCDTDTDMFLSPDSQNSVPSKVKATDPQKFVKELQDEQLNLITRAHEYQNKILERAWAKSQENAMHLPDGAIVIAYRAGMPHGRPRSKLQYPYSGPWKVIDRGQDDTHPRVSCMHCASKIVEQFGVQELRVLDLTLLDSDDSLAKAAERDDWDYTLDSIVDHKPKGSRKRRAKSSFEFLVKYKYLPESDEPGNENPSWQPYSSVAHTEALQRYCEIPQVLEQLGSRFFQDAE